MMIPNEKGLLPLHIALQNNVRLGSIKLLVRGNPSALRSLDNNFALPLHIACQHHDSASVVQYLLSQCGITLDTVDREWNTALHYACRGAKYDTIELLLDKFDAVSVSKRNAHKKLPIDLLLESNEVLDRESVEYTESIFRLLRAYPETVMNISTHAMQQSSLAAFKSSSGKKRKFEVWKWVCLCKVITSTLTYNLQWKGLWKERIVEEAHSFTGATITLHDQTFSSLNS